MRRKEDHREIGRPLQPRSGRGHLIHGGTGILIYTQRGRERHRYFSRQFMIAAAITPRPLRSLQPTASVSTVPILSDDLINPA
jgi:hypothetical protein